MNNQSKNKLKATHIDCKIPAHDMIDVCNFDLKVTLLALGRQLADLLYQLKDDCSHISCFSWLVVCCPGGGSSIRTRSASMDDAEGVALTHDSTSLFFTTLMALPKGVAALRQKHEHLILLVDSRCDFQALLKQDMFLLGPAGPSLRRILRNSWKISNSKWAYYFFSILCIFHERHLAFRFCELLGREAKLLSCRVLKGFCSKLCCIFLLFRLSDGICGYHTGHRPARFWPKISLDLAENSGYWIVLIGGYLV